MIPRRCRSVRHVVSMAVLAAALAGCSVGPNYQPPPLVLPDAWHAEVEGRLTGGEPELRQWWRGFDDDGLSRVVERVADHNRSLQAAAYRVAAARAVRNGADVAGLPKLGASGRLEWFRNSGNGLQSQFVAPQNENQVRLGGEVSWEIDVFGRVRRLQQAASADLEAEQEDYHDLLVMLRAEAALAYVDLRAAAQRLQLAQQSVEVQRGTLRQAQSRVATGLATGLDTAQAQASLASTLALLPGFERDQRTAENRLAVLLGEMPGSIAPLLGDDGPVPVPPAHLEVGVPADLLRQRPDLRAAERRYAAEVARIGVATAELYPRLSLSGFLGWESLDSEQLLTSRSRTHDLVPGLHWRLFEWGGIEADIAAQQATADAARADYEQVVLDAAAEAEDTLTGVAKQELQNQQLAAAAAASDRAVQIARSLYDQGLTSFQSVLDAQRSQLSSKDQLTVGRAELARLGIRLYRVLGGGVPPASIVQAQP